ncbi:Protein OS-9 [Gamsiella multidivaricata]|nr:Protein OS-9 [Gamsiella multidivaricata]
MQLSGNIDSQDQDGYSTTPKGSKALDMSSSIVMTDANGKRWACSIPAVQIQEEDPVAEKTAQETEEEERRSVKRGLELLEHLTGRCLKTNTGYWTYEYCHKKRIRQFHALDNIKWEPASEDTTNVLGVYEPTSAELQSSQNLDGSIQQRPSSSGPGRSATTTELGVSNERKYLVQHWDYGDVCDLTGALRKVEVQFQCANVDDSIQLVTEPSTCSYIMVIYSSSLCKDVAFELIPAPEANKIECRRIVSDEEYQQHRAAGPGAIEGGLGSITSQDSTGQIKFGQQAPQEESKPSLDNLFAAGSGMPADLRDVAALIEELEKTTKQKQLDEILAEFDTFYRKLKPHMSEGQKDVLQKIEDFVDGKVNQQELLAYDQNGQPIELDAFLETFFGTTDSSGESNGKKAAEGESGTKAQDSKAHDKEQRNQNIFNAILDALTENENKAAQDVTKKERRGKDAQTKAESNDVLANVDLKSLLDMLEAAKKAGANSGGADGKATTYQSREKEKREKDDDEK